MSTGGFILEIEIVADNPGIDFELNFLSSYSAETNQLWSSTINNQHPNGHLFIQNNGAMVLSSAYDFGVTESVNTLTSDDGSPIGDFPNQIEGVTQVLLEFEGVEPTTATDVTGTTIFSYNENADGTYNVLPFVEIGAGLFGSGDEYEFDASQNNLAEALVDKFTNFESPVLETSIGQQILLKSGRNVITGFNKSTKLNGNLSSQSRDAVSASSDDYYLLNSYVSTADLLPNTGPEVTLEDNVYTITGRGVKADDEFFFPVNIVKGKTYRIEGTLTKMVASNSIKFLGGGEESLPLSTSSSAILFSFKSIDTLGGFSFRVENSFDKDKDEYSKNGSYNIGISRT